MFKAITFQAGILLVITWASLSRSTTSQNDNETRDISKGPEMVKLQELWYSLRMQDATAGVMQSVAQQDSDTGEIHTREEMSMSIKRGEDSVDLWFLTTMVEDKNGTVIFAGYVQQMAEDKIKMAYNFSSSGIAVTSLQGGREIYSSLPPLTGQHQARWSSRQYFLKQAEAGAKNIQFSTIKPEMGARLLNVSSKLLRTENLEIIEVESTPTSVWETTMDTMPLKIVEWTNSHGDIVKMDIDSGAGRIEAIMSTKFDAENAMASESGAPELVDSTQVVLASPQPQLHSWTGSRTAVFFVSSKNDDAINLPHAGYQHVEFTQESGILEVTVSLDAPIMASEEDLANPGFVLPSAMIDSEDDAVRSIAEAAVGSLHRSPHGPRSKEEVLERAHKFRNSVKSHIKVFNLATGYASASESARRGEGDCSEHAVLLTALLRADDIPARVCSGLVYTERSAPAQVVERCISGDDECFKREALDKKEHRLSIQGSFAWHAWTQALINNHWIDLDATLWNVSYSVGHLLMGTSALEDAVGHADEMKLVSTIGNLIITVDSVH